jgi:hypothetical protein
MAGRRIAPADLQQEDRVEVLIDGRGEKQLDAVFPVHFERLMQAAPLVTGRARHVDGHASQSPAPADHQEKAVTVFIEHPEPHRLVRSGAGIAQP